MNTTDSKQPEPSNEAEREAGFAGAHGSTFMDNIAIARKAILEDLKARFKSGDVRVMPLDPKDSHRWYKPQDNYYSGAGEIPCPLCGGGKLQYQRSPYNGHVAAQCTNAKCGLWWRE